MGRRSKTGGVTPAGDRIQVRFTWQGKDLRPTLAMKPTAANLKHAARIRTSVMADIKAGTFNMAEYFPDYRNIEDQKANEARTLAEWADVWKVTAVRSLEDSTLTVYKRHLKAYWLSKFGHELPAAITHERLLLHLSELASTRITPDGKPHKPLARKTQNNIMIPLRALFEAICRADKRLPNPTEGIDNLKPQKPIPDPFSMAEVQAILPAAKKLFGEEIADYFEFACFAGFRPSEQIALLWPDVGLETGSVVVRRARVLAKDKERTKTSVVREVELNDRARAVIERQRARTQLAGAHVFVNPATGTAWHDEQTQRRMWAAILKKAKVRYRPPKECRDTSVTLALSAGADPVWVAKQHGHSLQVMMRDYAKWIPGADKGRNLAAINRALNADSAVIPQSEFGKNKKAL